MCLILVRDPNVQLDFEHIKHAALNNPHGWGYIIPDRGHLEIRRFFNAKGTDPEEVYNVLDENIDKRLFLHLRYATAGSRDKNNVHPFPVLQKRKHGMQAWLMHNGTLNDFSSHKSRMSDTYHFTEEVVRPLLERSMALRGKTKCINDPFVNKIIEKYSGWSKFLLVDNYGNYQTIGGGTQKEGYWVSNDYSFQKSYREEKTESKSYSYPSTCSSKHAPTSYPPIDTEYEDIYRNRVKSGDPFRTTTDSSTKQVPSYIETSPGVFEAKKDNNDAWPPEEPLELAEKTKFYELLGLNSLLDLRSFSESDLLDLINEYPDVMAVCVRDLIVELAKYAKE